MINKGDKYILMCDAHDHHGLMKRGNIFIFSRVSRKVIYTFDTPQSGAVSEWEFYEEAIPVFLLRYDRLTEKDQFLYELSGKIPEYIDWSNYFPDPETHFRAFSGSIILPEEHLAIIDGWWKQYYEDRNVTLKNPW